MGAASDEERREMRREYSRQWRAANPEKIAEYNRRWYEKNPEKRAEISSRYRESHREKLKEYGHAYYESHKEEIKARKRELYRMRKEEEKAARLAGLKEGFEMLLVSQDGREVVPAGAVNLSVVGDGDEWRVTAYSLSPGGDSPVALCNMGRYQSAEEAADALGGVIARCKPGGEPCRFPARRAGAAPDAAGEG